MTTNAHPTLLEVARQAGVAKSTASLAFSDPGRVALATRERVAAVAAEIGYAPNALAKSLATGRSDLIGLVTSEMRNPHTGAIQAAVQARALERGHLLLVGTSDEDVEREMRLLERFAAMRIRGALLVPASDLAAHGEALARMRLDIVFLDQRAHGPVRDHVGLDNTKAARLLVEHLVGLGHRRIAHVAGRHGLWTAEARLDGVRDALRTAGLALPDSMIVDGQFLEAASFEGCLELLRGPDRPSAVVAANNVSALGALRAIRHLGLRCPEDVSLAGIDSLPWGALIEPALTHVAQPLEAMARAATDRLIDRLEGLVEQGDEPVRIELAPRLVLGRSTGKAP